MAYTCSKRNKNYTMILIKAILIITGAVALIFLLALIFCMSIMYMAGGAPDDAILYEEYEAPEPDEALC